MTKLKAAAKPDPLAQPAEGQDEALKRRLFNLAVRANQEPPVRRVSVLLTLMWRFALPAVLKDYVARVIARGGLTWEDIFEDGNIAWAIRPKIGWRPYVARARAPPRAPPRRRASRLASRARARRMHA